MDDLGNKGFAGEVGQIDIGLRLRTVRACRNLSQRELARRAGVANGLISQIEQNHSSPSVSTIKRILDAIPLTLGEFFADDFVEELPDPSKFFFRADELRNINPNRLSRSRKSNFKAISLLQVGDARGRSLQMLHERYAPGADTGLQPYRHEAEEAGIIISGVIELTVGDKVGVLGPGDAYLFDSRVPHRFRNTGKVDCVIVSACTPPSF
jgi:transcriptional regulator with XRE-family HTH domain